MAKYLYVLLKNDSPNPILWKEQNDIAFKALKESLISPPALRHINDQIPLFLFVYENEANATSLD